LHRPNHRKLTKKKYAKKQICGKKTGKSFRKLHRNTYICTLNKKYPIIMKKIVLPALLAIGSLVGLTANAQVTGSLSVTLNSVLDIHIGSASGTDAAVNIPAFSNADAYTNGVQWPMQDHLFIVASKGFQIKAASTDLTTGAAGPTETISAAGINILGADGSTGSTGKPAGTSYGTGIDLSNTATAFISATGGTPTYAYKVTYTLGGGTTRAPLFIGKATGAYTATVTYTIVP
jgi:hypothetical protein